MRNYAYLFFNIVVLLPVVVLSLTTDVKPHRHWQALLGAYIVVSLPFILWDVWAAQAGHWGFSSVYITNSRFMHLPLEEILFFITVPFAMMYVWGVIKKFVADRAVRTVWPLLMLSISAAISVAILMLYFSNGYTRSAMIVALFAIGVVACSKLVFTQRFWTFQLVLLGIFLIANGFLTALPVITYGDASIIGARIFSIPLEDFFFNFAFLNLFLLTFNRLDIRTQTLTK
jgi:lycopene cyclase domain-containing protein